MGGGKGSNENGASASALRTIGSNKHPEAVTSFAEVYWVPVCDNINRSDIIKLKHKKV
jgi:hypothetical protein